MTWAMDGKIPIELIIVFKMEEHLTWAHVVNTSGLRRISKIRNIWPPRLTATWAIPASRELKRSSQIFSLLHVDRMHASAQSKSKAKVPRNNTFAFFPSESRYKILLTRTPEAAWQTDSFELILVFNSWPCSVQSRFLT